ncbi:MAG: zinc ribbon domain-containing protein [Planctomycetota bacterium]|nr:MAG: zinc ribbon domain-containing protein [Planctomycetota bacterium]
MPTYVYEVVKPDGTGGDRFELLQSMSEPVLDKHPETDEPVRRVITGFAIGGKNTAIGNPKMLSDKNLDRMGFTKYVKSGDGQYTKTVGSGPSQISADP